MRRTIKILGIGLALLTSCNWDVGECWTRAEEDGQTGAGGGPLVPGGGGYGDAPKPKPQSTTDELPPECDVSQQCSASAVSSLEGTQTLAYCDGPCKDKCPSGGVSGFSPSVFKFATVIPDDGKDEAGGYQAASAALSFYRWTTWLPESWTCSLTVGMPIRTQAYGIITPASAASMTAAVASEASFSLMQVKPEIPPGIYCSKLVYTMRDLFKAKYPNLGASVKL